MNTSANAHKLALVEHMGDLVQQMYAQCRCESTEGWTELELTMPQLHTMALLSQGPQRMGVIAWRLSSSQSAATSMIDRLVVKCLVERVPDNDDRRVVDCQLTESGREEMERLMEQGNAIIESNHFRLTPQGLRFADAAASSFLR